MRAAALFARTLGGSTNQHVYESLGLLVGQCVKAVILLACGVLIMNRRTRDTACGLALGVVLIVDTNSFWKLRPSRLSSEYDALGISVSLANFGLRAVGMLLIAGAGICRFLLGRREDRYLVPELTGTC